MSKYSLSHVSDAALAHDLATAAAHDRASTAVLLAHIAEFDARKLYLPAAHPSMYSYCVGELGLSEDAAYKRIQAARAAREFPAIFPAVAEGRLHLAGVCLLAPHLTPGNADELIAAAARKPKSELERMLAERFPRSELLPMVAALPPATATVGEQLAPGQVEAHAAERVEIEVPQRVAPIAPQRFALQVTVGQGTHDKLRYAQSLLGHVNPDLAQVLDRALDALIHELERRKFAATGRPRHQARRSSANPRRVPAAIRCAVWERDQGQCTFRGDNGTRCPARAGLEFYHVEPVARGGRATVDNLRLRCRAHNQYDAECAFGAGFMERKREAARAATAEAREAATAAKRKQAAAEVIPYLRTLGFRADESRAAAALCEPLADTPLEQRVKLALSYFANRHCTRWKPAAM
jgi:hypothetical protein